MPPSSNPGRPREVGEGALREILVLSSSGLLLRYYPQTRETRRHADALTSIFRAVEIFTVRIFDSHLGDLISMAFTRDAVGLVMGRYLRVAYVVGGRDLGVWVDLIAQAIDDLETVYGAGLAAPVGLYPEVIRRFDEVFQAILALGAAPRSASAAA